MEADRAVHPYSSQNPSNPRGLSDKSFLEGLDFLVSVPQNVND